MHSRIRISENERFLAQENGQPFFYLGDTAWELFYRLTREEADHYLQARASQRFTVIQAVLLSEFGQARRPNSYGDLPLVDQDPERPNEPFFAHVDYMVRQAEALGLHMGLLPAWADLVGPTQWGTNPILFNPDNARHYGEFLGRRYRDSAIIWILGGDRPVVTEEQRAVWRAMAEGIRTGDEGRHLMTFHPMGGRSSSDDVNDEPWLQFNMIQTSHGAHDGKTCEFVQRDYERLPVRPTMEGEYCYENHPVNWKPELGRFDDYDARKGAYWSLFAGGHGFTYGCVDIFPFFEPGLDPDYYTHFGPCIPWREALHLPGAEQMRHARALMESRPFFTRIPDQALITSDTLSGSDHIRATRDSAGTYAMVYSASGQPFTANFSALRGEAGTASWFNPREGSFEEIGRFPLSGEREFTPPTSGYGQDWVLVVDADSGER